MTWSFLSPCHHVEGNRGIDRLDDDSQVGNHCDCVGRFNDDRGSYNCNAGGSLIHGYVW